MGHYKEEFSKIVIDVAAAGGSSIATNTPIQAPNAPPLSQWEKIVTSYDGDESFSTFFDLDFYNATELKYSTDSALRTSVGNATDGNPDLTSLYSNWIPFYFLLGGGMKNTVNTNLVVDYVKTFAFIDEIKQETGKPLSDIRLYAAEKGKHTYYQLDFLAFQDSALETSFKTNVLPVIQQYFQAWLARDNVDQGDGSTGAMSLQLKSTYQQWYDESQSQFFEKFKELAKAIYDKENRFDTGTAVLTIRLVPSDKNTTPIRFLQYLTGVFSLDMGNAPSIYVQPRANDYILEWLGFTEWAEEKAPDNWNWETDDDGDRTAAGLEAAAAANDGFWKEMVVATFGTNEDASESELLTFRQCALMTDLLQDTNKSDFSYYWLTERADDTKPNASNFWRSPLSVYYKSKDFPGVKNQQASKNAAHYRIYPVSTAYDSTNFINHASVDLELMKEIFTPENADSKVKGPLSMEKGLFWVYEGSDEKIREKPLTLSSYEDGANARQKLRELIELDRIYETVDAFNQPAAIARLSIVGKDYGVPGKQVAPSQADLPQALIEQRKDILGTSDISSNAYFSLKGVNIKYDGTNISTARKDVEVELTWEVGDIGSLEAVIATMTDDDKPPVGSGRKVRLIDLVTLPHNNSPSVRNGPTQWLANQYSPNYSRLRLKVTPGQVGGDANSTSTMIIDLTTIDHSINRDDDSGRVDFTINYRGFFETSLEMPYNDVLADDSVIEARQKRQEEAIDKLMANNCSPQLVRKVMRMEQEVFARESRSSTYSTIIKKLEEMTLIHSYELNKNDYNASIVGNTFVAQKNLVKDWTPGWSNAGQGGVNQQIIGSTEYDTLNQKLSDARSKNESANIAEIIKEDQLLTLKNRFFFLGDLLWVSANCLYKTDSAEMRKHVDNLNMRFMVLPINVPKVGNPEETVSINPLSIPIDLAFFIRWFDENITNKGLGFYPVGSFIRDLIDKLVNSLIYDVCFNNLLPDETPCVLRGQIFSTTNKNFFNKDFSNSREQGSINFDITHKNKIIFPKSGGGSENATSIELEDTNYYVIYPLVPSFKRNQPREAGNTLKDKPYTISLFQGQQNADWNFLTNVSFSKVTAGNLREARLFNNSFGSLSLLSNVYDLSFTFYRRKGNTFLFPGSIINFYLLDFGKLDISETNAPWRDNMNYGDSDPHKAMTSANIHGFGGYFIVKSVEYKLGETGAEFEIHVNTKFLGTDAINPNSRLALEDKNVKIPKECADAFNLIANRANSLAVEGDEIFTPNTNGDSSVKNPGIDESKNVSGVRSSEVESPDVITVQTVDDLNAIIDAAMKILGTSTTTSGVPWKEKVTYKCDKDGKITGQTASSVNIDSIPKEVLKSISQENRQFATDLTTTKSYVDDGTYYYQAVITVKEDKSFTLTINEYTDPDTGGPQ